MRVIDRSSYKIVIIDTESDIVTFFNEDHDESNLIYVPLNGTNTTLLSPDRFLVKNYDSSFLNHMMWEGLLGEEEQDEYIMNRCDKFFTTGQQMLIEDYDFQEDEPFYDYSR